ncbi:unnamed protein product [Albugo candida]|uniref:Cytochrome c oxidase subunit n=1 Tax=Albugo candida TaxID=65357 RepID=A0A024GDF2_9STRA|nr:unnamed protein product [Albugo candida]|eukprot:CCI44876.1 unnamed protein product [Albugo candida]
MSEEQPFRTTPGDPRFPNQNQAQHCWAKYILYARCMKDHEDDEEICQTRWQQAKSICPSAWTDRWNEEREECTFAGI